MRIGITTSVMQRGRSGVGQYVLSLARALAARPDLTHEFVLFVLREDLPLFDFAAGRMTLEVVEEAQRSALRDILWHQTRLPGLARRLGLDVVHVPSYRRMTAGGGYARVATIHDLAPFRLAGKYDWARMLYGRLIVPRLAKRQHAVIAVSETTATDIRRFLGVGDERLSVILNGIDHTRFRPEPTAVRRPSFLYVSRLEHPAKNHVRLIEAFEEYRLGGGAWELHLAGSDWHGASEIHARIARSSCAGSIRTLGFVADADLPGLYQRAGALVYPSLFEGFGLPVVEAMACGCPVLCSTRGSLGEVSGAAARHVDPESPADLAAGLRAVAEDERLRADLAARGQQRARDFAWERAAEQCLSVYAAALARARGRTTDGE